MCSHHGHTTKFLLPTENAVLSPRRRTGTMKKRAKLTMSSLALALLCCCSCLLALASGLPITSKPLDNNPDHLTWEAAWLSGDSRSAGSGGKAKKITPKSIFIAPQLNGYNGSLCPPDMKVDYNGKCIQIVNINPADIVLTKLQSLLGNGGGGTPNAGGDEDYDYEYDTSGPFQVNLPLSIDLPAEPPKRVESFYDSPLIDTPASDSLKQASTVAAYPQQSTFLAETSKRPTMDQTAAESHTDISFLAFESLPNGTLSTQLELDGNNGPVVQQIVLSSTTAAPSSVTTLDTSDVDASSTSATSTIASTVESSSISVDSISTTMSSTTEELSTSTTESSTSTEGGTTYTTGTFATTTEEKPVSSDTFAATTTLLTTLNDTGDAELDNLKTELAEESLLFDATGQSSTTELPSTFMSDFNTEFGSYSTGSTPTEDRFRSTTSSTESSTESTTPIETTTMKVLIHTMPPTRPPPIRLPASPKPIQIVTPVRTKWYSPPGATPPPFIVASYTQQERTTRATPETTTVAQRQRPTEAPLLVINDTEADKKNRDSIHRQELKDKLRETMDTNNRFVYHHLPASASSTAKLPPTTSASFSGPDQVYVDQLKKINEIMAENKQRHQQQQHMAAGGSRIRFPSTSSRDEDQTAVGNSNVVRFPGSVSNRVTPTSNRLPDIFPKKSSSPDSTTQRPPFWWLPSGWEVDQTGQKPMLLRFWSRMPLVRDQSLTTNSAASTSSGGGSSSSTTNNAGGRWKPSPALVPGHTSPSSVGAARGNSKSPSENFYKEVSSQDVYKVLNMRQLKHKR